jgi:hypothetical protein
MKSHPIDVNNIKRIYYMFKVILQLLEDIDVHGKMILTNYVTPEPAGSSPYLQQPATGPYPESTGSTLNPQPISLRSILISYFHQSLGLSSGLFPPGFPTKTLCTFLSHACHMSREDDIKTYLKKVKCEDMERIYLLQGSVL